MKKIIVSSLLILCSILSTGCMTAPEAKQLGRDSTAVLDNPTTSAVLLGVIGGVIDKTLLNGDGTAGAVAGLAIGYQMGERRQERLAENRPFRCNRRQHAEYDATGRHIDSDSEDCRREYSRPVDPKANTVSDTYTYSVKDAPTQGSAAARSDDSKCQRYNADGKVNPDC